MFEGLPSAWTRYLGPAGSLGAASRPSLLFRMPLPSTATVAITSQGRRSLFRRKLPSLPTTFARLRNSGRGGLFDFDKVLEPPSFAAEGAAYAAHVVRFAAPAWYKQEDGGNALARLKVPVRESPNADDAHWHCVAYPRLR